MQSLRQRQIDEIRNSDLNINKQVVAALNKQVATFGETVASPTTDQAVNTDKLLNFIDNFNVHTTAEINEISQLVITDVRHPGLNIEKFNTIMRLRTLIIKNNYNSKNLINQQMQTMIPPINSFIIGYNNEIEDFLSRGVHPDTHSQHIARFYSTLAIAETCRSSLVTGSYRPIELTDVDETFNKMIQKLPNDVKQVVLLGLTKSPLSGFNRGNGEGYEEAKKRLETELGRPLTKSDDLMLAIRMGNFSQYKPILSNTQVSALDTNQSIDISNVPRKGDPRHATTNSEGVPIPPAGLVPSRDPPMFPEGFIPQTVPHTALQNEQNEDNDPQSEMTDISGDDQDSSHGHGFKRRPATNVDLHYRDDRNEDPYGTAGKGKSILSRFA